MFFFFKKLEPFIVTPAAGKMLFQKLAVLQAVSYKPLTALPQQPKHDAPRGAVLQLCAEAILLPGSQSVPPPSLLGGPFPSILQASQPGGPVPWEAASHSLQ